MPQIDLITGFLGAGKTTFIKDYAKFMLDQQVQLGILENDYGAINIDMVLLQDLMGENCEVEMVIGGDGILSHRRRFQTKLISMAMTGYDCVIVEPSGIFDMDEFFDTIHESPLDRWFEVGSVLTIIDAETDDVLPEQMEYLFASEAACCGKLILSKRDSFPDESDQQVTERVLSHLNRALTGIKCDRSFTEKDLLIRDWDSLTDSDFTALASAGYRGSAYIKRYHPGDMISGVHYFMNIAMAHGLIVPTIEKILTDPGCGRIMRVKGSLPDGCGGLSRCQS